jgi:hypothetical protein
MGERTGRRLGSPRQQRPLAYQQETGLVDVTMRGSYDETEPDSWSQLTWA